MANPGLHLKYKYHRISSPSNAAANASKVVIWDNTEKPVSNDHLSDKIYYLWFIP